MMNKTLLSLVLASVSAVLCADAAPSTDKAPMPKPPITAEMSADAAVKELTAWSNRLFPIYKDLDRAPVLAAAEALLERKDLTEQQRFSILNLEILQHEKLGNIDAALALQDKALSLQKITVWQKVDVLVKRARLYIKRDQLEEAEKCLKQGFAYEDLRPQDRLTLCRELAVCYSLMKRPEQAEAILADLEKKHSELKKGIDGIRAAEYERTWQFEKAADLYAAAGNVKKAMSFMLPERRHAYALKILEDKTMSETDRMSAWFEFFTSEPGDRVIRDKYREEMKALKSSRLAGAMARAKLHELLQNGSYENAQALLQVIRSYPEHRDVFYYVKWQTVSLYALKRDAEAAALAKEYADFEKFGAKERLYLKLLAEFEGGKFVSSLPGIMKEFAAAEKVLSRDEQSNPMGGTGAVAFNPAKAASVRSDALTDAGRAALIAGKEDELRAIEKANSALFRQYGRRVFDVPFFSTPVRSAADFLALKNPPKPQLMDRAFGGSTEFFDTDVTTGDRGKNIGKDSGKDVQFTEFTALCDEYGLHLFFKVPVKDPEAVKAGLAGAGAYEMYLAPGFNQPYSCVVANVAALQVSAIFNTTYDNAGSHRINQKNNELLRDNVFGKDFILDHFFFAWTAFPMTLPEEGDLWEFENVLWSSAGGFCWNGTESIHGRSTWGLLRFHLTDAARRAVKRQVIYDALKKYQKQKTISWEHRGEIFHWQDPVLGDTEFYDAEVKPLVEKLDAFVPLVKTNMSDADTDKVFREAVPLWENLPFEIARLRSLWLQKSLMKE